MIPFKYGTQEEYERQVKDNSALYFISDTKRIYRGEELIAGVQALVVNELPSYTAAVPGILYVLVKDDLAKLYVKGEYELVPLTGEVEDQGIKSISVFDSSVILTSEDNLDNVDDSTLMTSKAITKLIEASRGIGST